MTDAFGMLSLTNVLLAKGDYAGAMQIVEKFEQRLQGKSRPYEFGEAVRTLRVRVQLASGDLQTAADWAEQISYSEDFHRNPEYYLRTLARIRLAQGRYEQVEALLTGRAPEGWAGNRITRQIEADLMLAAAVAAAGAGTNRLPEAMRIVEACLALGEPEGYICIFLEGGETVRELLTAYLRSAAPGHAVYAQRLLDAFPPGSGAVFPAPQTGGLVEPLSEREQEVLHLMALGRTNQEIARQLVVARGTIKAHAASIYRKLDVANRTEAVTRARHLGILP